MKPPAPSLVSVAMKAQAISVRFPQDLYDELRRQADDSGVPIALVVRAHVKLSIDRGRDVSELIGESALPIGGDQRSSRR